MENKETTILQILSPVVKNNSFTMLPVNTVDNLDENLLTDAFETEPGKGAINNLNLNKFKFKTDNYTVLFSNKGIFAEDNSTGEILEANYDLDIVFPILKNIINNRNSILLKKNENNLCIAAMMFKYVEDSKGLCGKFQELLSETPKDEIDTVLLFEHACLGGNVELFKFLLLNYKYDIIDEDNISEDIMYYAFLGGNSEIIRTLIQEKFVINNESLEGACASGDPRLVWFLLDNYLVDFNLENNKNEIIQLFKVINNPEIANIFLFERGILDINSIDNYGRNILYYIAMGGHLGIMEFLVKTSTVDLNRRGRGGRTVLHYAAESGNVEALKFLLQQPGMNLNSTDNNEKTILHYAAESGNVEALKFLLQQQSGIDLDSTDFDGKTILHYAINSGNPEIVRALLKHSDINANITTKDRQGNEKATPLEAAIEKGNIEIVRALLKHSDINANITTKDRHGNEKTLLEIAIEKRDIEIVRALLECPSINANIITKDNRGNEKTLLEIAIEKRDIEIVRALLECPSIDVNIVTNNRIDEQESEQKTPLEVAIGKGDIEIVRALLKCPSIDVNIVTNNRIDEQESEQKTPLEVAIEKGNTEIFKELYNHKKIDLNKIGTNDKNPLYLAVSWGKEEIVDFLLEQSKTDVNIVVDDGESLIQYAAVYSMPGIVRSLVNHPKIDFESVKKAISNVVNSNISYSDINLDILLSHPKIYPQTIIKDERGYEKTLAKVLIEKYEESGNKYKETGNNYFKQDKQRHCINIINLLKKAKIEEISNDKEEIKNLAETNQYFKDKLLEYKQNNEINDTRNLNNALKSIIEELSEGQENQVNV